MATSIAYFALKTINYEGHFDWVLEVQILVYVELTTSSPIEISRYLSYLRRKLSNWCIILCFFLWWIYLVYFLGLFSSSIWMASLFRVIHDGISCTKLQIRCQWLLMSQNYLVPTVSIHFLIDCKKTLSKISWLVFYFYQKLFCFRD